MEIQQQEQNEEIKDIEIKKKPIADKKNLAIFSLSLLTALSFTSNIISKKEVSDAQQQLATLNLKMQELVPTLQLINVNLDLYEGIKGKQLDEIAKIYSKELDYISKNTYYETN